MYRTLPNVCVYSNLLFTVWTPLTMLVYIYLAFSMYSVLSLLSAGALVVAFCRAPDTQWSWNTGEKKYKKRLILLYVGERNSSWHLCGCVKLFWVHSESVTVQWTGLIEFWDTDESVTCSRIPKADPDNGKDAHCSRQSIWGNV